MTIRTIRATFFIATAACLLAGCSSATVRRDDASRGTPAAEAARASRVSRPPDVTSRPRAFRLADADVRQADVRQASGATPPAMPLLAQPAAAARPGNGSSPATRQAAQHPSAGEIRGMMRDYLRAFNRHDAAALASHWSPTGENHDLDAGVVTASGRESVRQVFAALFHADDEAVIDLDVTAIRPVTDDVAMIDGVTTISFAASPPAGSTFSAVVVKRDGRWLLEHVRESARKVPALEETARHHLDHLAWLVGSWEDEGQGVTASTLCEWAGDGSYLVRTHTVAVDRGPELRPADGDQRIPGLLPAGPQKPREVMEVIGWDPDSRAVRSWFFGADGRFAEGIWTRSGDGWEIHVVGRGRDEGCTAELVVEPDADRDSLTIRGNPGRLTNLLPPGCPFGRTSR